MKLSIVVPVYNEEKTILEMLKRIERVALGTIKKEIIIVDDGSIDRTREILQGLGNRYQIIFQDRNYGKGFAIRTALNYVRGDIVLIQDADLEYQPDDYPRLLKPILEDKAQVVYGSRILGIKAGLNEKTAGRLYSAGGKLITVLANLLYGINITDEPTGYKVFRAELLKKLNLQCQRFEFCPEVTAKIAKRKINIVEVPINYSPRSKQEGKKIAFKDALEAIRTLIKYRFRG